jgi:tetratricopeptide (TPR) repeat protein
MIPIVTMLAAALAAPQPDVPLPRDTFLGPDHIEVDALRTSAGGPRIYVQAELSDGELGLFLVDTGAATSVLSEDTAKRLGVPVDEDWGYVEGLGGRDSYDRAVLGSIKLGDAVVPDVEMAVGVRGVGEYAGAMPLDGILGNNVWARFTLEIDYPSDTIILHRPGTVKRPHKKWSKLWFDGSHVRAPIEVTTSAAVPHTHEVMIQIDTGASELLLSGSTGRGFDRDYTEGVEPVLGIGASEYMPSSMMLRRTRRIPIDRVLFGGREVDVDIEARWLNFDAGAVVGPAGMQGLAGHELMAGHAVTFAYQDGWFALKKAKRKPRQIDGHEVLLGQDIARYGDDPTRYLYRARLHAWMGHADESTALLEAFLSTNPDDAEGRVLLAKMRRIASDLDGAWEALQPLSAEDLVQEGEIVAAVNGLLLEARIEEAVALAEAAIDAMPADSDDPTWGGALVARSDALFAMGDLDGARAELLEAATMLQNPDAHLMRRARIALASGDRLGAITKIRKLLQLYPSGGPFLWFYVTMVEEAEADLFRYDMGSAVGRLHPRHRPLDFMVAAHASLGDSEISTGLMNEGITRDCEGQLTGASRDNCLAWYYALSGNDPAEALKRITRALDVEGDRSDFLDTKAIVHLSREEYAEAHDAAIAAARLSPDDVYMLWQAERIGQIARQKTGGSTKGSSAPTPEAAAAVTPTPEHP